MMNNLLQLKGHMKYASNKNRPSFPKLPKNGFVESSHIGDLILELEMIKKRWTNETLIGGALFSVSYKQVVAKSNRISTLFSRGSKETSNDTIRGAKFNYINDKKIVHVFTHFMDLDLLDESINNLKSTKKLIDNYFGGVIYDYDIEKEIKNRNIDFKAYNLSMGKYFGLVRDCFYVDKFYVDEEGSNIKDKAIVTLYKTKYSTTEILKKLNIRIDFENTLDDTTVNLMPSDLNILKNKAPYLIAMSTKDLAAVDQDDYSDVDDSLIEIPDPTNEPTIGVIDTPFSKNVYFHKWVKYEEIINPDLIDPNIDYDHGTAVSSLIVDGPSFNPNLNDGCGRFRVKHIGAAKATRFSSFTVLKTIRDAVIDNPNIKVWNLSLGSNLEIEKSFISPEAAELDRIQSEYNVIFVISGTNARGEEHIRIGAPADSLNSIVVNSVKKNNEPASYYRTGPVLEFFHKPDLSYYGGDNHEYIRVCTGNGEKLVSGTSFAAPWITRKLAFLIYKMGFTREIAKALLIDSAAGWNRKDDMTHSIGYGVVPIRIEDVINCKNDEIRFYISSATDSYETFTYDIPIPTDKDRFPYYARATLCYFPRCSRNQGVDYTNTEMDIHFGRVQDKNGKVSISSINGNKQDLSSQYYTYEGPARELYRKWDNVKHISEKVNPKSRPKQLMGSLNWGISIKTKERLSTHRDEKLNYGVVITIKEMNGVNRISDFIKMCSARGWLVNEVDVNNKLDIFNKAEEDLSFD